MTIMLFGYLEDAVNISNTCSFAVVVSKLVCMIQRKDILHLHVQMVICISLYISIFQDTFACAMTENEVSGFP